MAYTANSRSTCPHARTFIQISEQVVFSKITEHTSTDQLSDAEAILRELCYRLEAQVDMFHYPAATGNHWCVRDVADHAILALKGLAAMHQQPAPSPILLPEPAPEPREPSLEDVVTDFEAADELFLSDIEQGDSKE